MSEREKLYQLLDTVPDTKIAYVIGYVQGLTTEERDEPNEETLEAFAEVEEMKRTESGQHFSGSTEDFLTMILEE